MTQKETWLDAAHSIGVKLSRDALWSGSRCNWLGCSMELVGTAWVPVQKSFGGDLYAGTSGIALFLADLAAETGERIFRQTAEGALALALSRLSEFPPETSLGFYSGLTGVAYALMRCGEKLEQDSYTCKALEILRKLAVVDLARQGLDVISGVAGAIPALLLIGRKFNEDTLLNAATRCGEHLLEKARPGDAGWSWDTLAGSAPAGQKDLTGFSHGTAGIAWAFLELERATGEAKFRNGADQAFQYERHWYSPEQQNWPDFRSFNTAPGAAPGPPSYNVAWCHGAPGIGLSRLRAFALTGDTALKEEAEIAMRTTTNMLQYVPATGQANYSLCHGCAGNAELLLMADSVLGGDGHRKVAEQMMEDGIARYPSARTPWPCGVPGGWETPNLMLGTAGTGHFLLRLYNPAIPTVMIVGPD
jgi:lantibiotic biosynthesis protein